MSKKVQAWVFGVGLLIILMLPILFEYTAKKRVDVISYNEYNDLFDSGDFALVYFGNTDSKDYSDIKANLSALKVEFDVNITAVNYNKLSAANASALKKDLVSTEGYVFIKDKQVAYVLEGETTTENLEVLINKIYNGIIPDEDVNYKSLSTYDEFMRVVNSKKTTMFVFGRDNCPYCNKYKPIYNEVAGEYKLDIYYMNTLTLDKTEFNKILNSGLTIPAECNDSKQEELLSSINGVPLTIFTKSGKTVGCIGGSVGEEELLSKLKTVGMIK